MFGMVFNIDESKDTQPIVKAVSDFNERINSVKGGVFFDGRASYLTMNSTKAVVIFDFRVVYPPIHWIFLFIAALTGYFGLIFISVLMACLFAAFIFVRSNLFYHSLFIRGLRKQGYNGVVKRL